MFNFSGQSEIPAKSGSVLGSSCNHQFQLQIFVSDVEETERQTIELIVLEPVVNQAPVFPGIPYQFQLPENATASTELGSLGVTDEGGWGLSGWGQL